MRNWTATTTLDKSDGKQYFLSCEQCSSDTKHLVIRSAHYSGSATDLEFDWFEVYQIVECQGCESLSFRKCTGDSESYYTNDDGGWIPDEKTVLFPARISGRRRLSNTHYLPSEVSNIYDEVTLALSSPQPVLAGIGIRALVESVCKEKTAAGSNLEIKIDDLVTKGFLTQDAAEILHGLRFLGNDAAHEGKPHSAKTLSIALDVIENLLTNVYILPKIAATELKRRP